MKKPRFELRTDMWEEHEKTQKALQSMGFIILLIGILNIGGILLKNNRIILVQSIALIIIGILINETHKKWSKKIGTQ